MFWTVVLSMALLCAGYVIGAYGCLIPLTCVVTGMPVIRYLEAAGVKCAKKMRRYEICAIILWLTVDTAAVLLVLYFAPKVTWYFFFGGAGLILLLGLGRTGPNLDNMLDLAKTVLRLGDEDDIDTAGVVLEAYPLKADNVEYNFDKRVSRWWRVSTVLLIVALLVSGVYMWSVVGVLFEQLETTETQLESVRARNERLLNSYNAQIQNTTELREEILWIESAAVICNPDDMTYHRFECSHNDADSYYIFNVEFAQGRGYSPCEWCSPAK